jgi:hypothetical protein
MGGRTRTSGQGRRKGVPNKLTRDVKEMILGALSAKGGQKYLERCAEENMAAFLTLVGKVLPLQLAAEGGGPLTITLIGYGRQEGNLLEHSPSELPSANGICPDEM